MVNDNLYEATTTDYIFLCNNIFMDEKSLNQL